MCDFGIGALKGVIITTLHILHAAVVQYEADQSDPLLCLVTLVPTDPDVAVLVENRYVALLLRHFVLDGSTMSKGTLSFGKEVRSVHPVFLAVDEVELAL